MTVHKTYAETLATLREVVAERGEDFVYTPTPVPFQESDLDGLANRCTYFVMVGPDRGQPSCGVGAVLAKWGFGLANVGTYNFGAGVEKALRACDIEPCRVGASWEPPEGDAPGPYLLGQFQRFQDAGRPYGYTYTDARIVALWGVNSYKRHTARIEELEARIEELEVRIAGGQDFLGIQDVRELENRIQNAKRALDGA